MKFNIWQIFELLSIILGLFKSARKHGSLVIDEATRKSMEESEHFESIKTIGIAVAFIYSMFWVIVAYMGNCQGIWLVLYMAGAGITFSLSKDRFDNEKTRYTTRHNFWRSLATFSVFNYFLYMGGFWQGVLP